jgi:hypothetical protein
MVQDKGIEKKLKFGLSRILNKRYFRKNYEEHDKKIQKI